LGGMGVDMTTRKMKRNQKKKKNRYLTTVSRRTMRKSTPFSLNFGMILLVCFQDVRASLICTAALEGLSRRTRTRTRSFSRNNQNTGCRYSPYPFRVSLPFCYGLSKIFTCLHPDRHHRKRKRIPAETLRVKSGL
jgi:hypothetical protein